MNDIPTNSSHVAITNSRMDVARKHFADGNFAKAERSCQRILKIEQENPEALHLLGVVAHHLGDNDRAIRLIAMAADRLDNKAPALNDLGSILMIENRLPEAIQKFSRAIKADPELSEAHENLAKAYVQAGRPDKASDVLYAAMSRDPENGRLEELLEGLPGGKGVWFSKIRVENTNACRYACQMCPREKLSRDMGVMSPDDYKLVLDRLRDYIAETDLPTPYKGLFFLQGFGEPLLDENLATKSAMVAEQFPMSESLIVTTLGESQPHTYFEELLGAGQLKNIIVSFYGFQKDTYEEVHVGGDFETARGTLIDIARLNDELGRPCKITLQVLTPHTQRTLEEDPEETKAFDELMAILEPLDVQVRGLPLHNFGNGRSFFDPNLDKSMCSVVSGHRRRQLNVTWDLKVVPCAFDFNSEMALGDLRTQSILEIYESDAFNKFLDAHRTGKLGAYPVCQGCNMR